MTYLSCVLHLCVCLAVSGSVTVLPGVSAPGDIIIAGLFPVHTGIVNANLSYPKPPECKELYLPGLTRAMAMIQAVESINRSPLLGGLRLGYRLYDSCSDVTTSLYVTESLMRTDTECRPELNSTSCPPPVMAVVGPAISELSIAIARQLNLDLIPQISYESSAVILSDKTRFPAFMRTVPTDDHQTCAMVKLLSDSGWNWVGMVTTDGDYGRSALNSFVSQAAEAGICVAFKEILPNIILPDDSPQIKQVVRTIRAHSKVKVILAFVKPSQMKTIFSYVGQEKLDRVWIASDSWSTSKDLLDGRNLRGIGKVVGFTFKRGNISSFHHFLRNLDLNGHPLQNSSFLAEFRSQLNHSQSQGLIQGQLPVDTLIESTKPENVFSINMAVNAIAYAMAKLCSVKNCNDSKTQYPWELLAYLRQSTFQLEGESYTFDPSGDLNLGYDVTLWRSEGRTIDVSDVVAHYVTRNKTFLFENSDNRKKILDLQMVESRCSPTCQQGQFKKTTDGQHTCCYECINCTENQFTNDTDMDQCINCDTETEWAPVGNSHCIPKTLEFFSWQDGFTVFLVTLAALGILLVFLVAVLFLKYRQTPVVKAAGGPICFLILLSLTGSFVSTILFVGQPTDLQCQVRQVLYGLSFTCCVSCILVKSLKILLAFHFNPGIQTALHRLYKPYWIIGVCVGLQALLCTLWLVFEPPRAIDIPNLTTILSQCFEGSYGAFGAMLGYVALLAIVCFGFAFKGRKLPEHYNEAKFITFGLLIYFISWVIFIPSTSPPLENTFPPWRW
ncbi:hypothetical protein AGOR_G00204840 [Albula goreensis]|uniref:G-protein coupled receptor family C group 6 member A n=1 Tax=Albula goreensis TaxID=1534307 RepID=A0A8T3CNI5_9TELE|nr:hypothetical protein AGOR_G00204840 [Albula goreensis]